METKVLPGGSAEVVRHPCAFTPGGADKALCQRQSRLLRLNSKCAGCESPWRICVECAKSMHITEKSVVVHAASGLCAEHSKEAGVSTEEEETSDDLLAMLKRVGDKSLEIPVEQIRPRRDQPRQHFDEAELNALAVSIKKSGQQQPGIVVKIEPDENGCIYELDDGERRWRACQIAGVPMYRANIVPEHLDSGTRFLRSAVTNFNRSNHTLLEEVDMVVKLVEEYGYKQVDIAVSLGKPSTWVSQRYGLRRLHPAVRAKLDAKLPRQERLGLVAALRLSPMPPDVQLQMLSSVMGASHQELAHVVRNAGVKHGYTSRRRRAPSDDFRTIQRGLKAARKQLELLQIMNADDWENAFRGRPRSDIAELQSILEDLHEFLPQVALRLGEKLK